MDKKILILHSWFGSTKADWYPWLKNALESKGYTVYLPDFPELRTDVPDMELILSRIMKEVPIDNTTTVIGHSIGCLLTMRLAERIVFEKMILVAGWDYDDLCEGHVLFWKTKLNHALIRSHVAEKIVIHSDNDPYYTAIAGEDMAKRLEARFMLVKGAGHFNEKSIGKKLPQILEVL